MEEQHIGTMIAEHYLQIVILAAGAVAAVWGLWIRYLRKGACAFCEAVSNFYKIPRRLTHIYNELSTNGGKSLVDKVNCLHDRQEIIIRNQIIAAEKSKIILDDHPVCIIETDVTGKVTWANATYLILVDRRLDEIQGHGWVNVVAQEERTRVFQAWLEAVQQQRPFEEHFKMQKPDGTVFDVIGCAFPIEVKNEIQGYLGKVKIMVVEEVSPGG